MNGKIVFEIVAASIAVMILTSGVAVGVNTVYTATDGSESQVSLPPPAIYVPDDYSTIQAAVNAASPGDTIIVRDGTYNETVKVDKRLTLRSENGSDKTIVQAANSEDHIFKVTAGHVNISGFTVRGASDDTGIYIYCANNCVISNNTCSNIDLVDFFNNNYGIRLYSSSNNTVEGNTVSNNCQGIDLKSSSNNTITGNNVSSNAVGIHLSRSSNNTVEGNTVYSNNDRGIYLSRSSNNTIASNKVSNNYGGIYLADSSNNTITGNNVSSNVVGIYLDDSSNNTISSNNVSGNNMYGIYLRSSSNSNTISDNTFVNDGLTVFTYQHNTIEGNTVNGKPLVYLEDVSDYKVEDAGQVILVNCNNITVENLDLSYTNVGVVLWKTENSKISNNTVCNNKWGICLDYSSNNIITGNNASNNNDDGISLDYSSNNKITNNTCSHNVDSGISLGNSNNNSIVKNTCTKNVIGIFLWGSSNNYVTSNKCSVNRNEGLYLKHKSTKNSILDNTCLNNKEGIALESSAYNSISYNTCSHNKNGFLIFEASTNNCISNNNCSNNGEGIFIWLSNNNLIYCNNFINNYYNVDSGGSTNVWNSTEEITYTHNGSTYKSYLGNYWDDYEGTDAEGDGIGDTHYSIDTEKDESDDHPLMGSVL